MKPPASPAVSPISPFTCSDIDQFGNRCSAIGVFSASTVGGGPWYCRAHDPFGATKAPPPRKKIWELTREARAFLIERGILREGMTEKQRIDACRKESARLAKLVHPEPSKDWASMIEVRVADGEELPLICQQLAGAVLKADGKAMDETKETSS